MPKNPFEQPIKREKPPIEEMKKKLDKAREMIERVKKELKIKEFEVIDKSVKELKKLWEENEKEAREKEVSTKIFSFFSSLPLPEVPPSLLERISNRFLKEFDWERFEKRNYLGDNLGFFISAFLKKSIETYISSQKEKGIREENIKPIEIHLRVKELPIRLSNLGYQNPKKLHLIIEGDVNHCTGESMEGGEIIVKGNCRDWTGSDMQGGRLIVKGNCEDSTGRHIQGGKLIVEGNCRYRTGQHMQGGELVIKENCGNLTGPLMRGGRLILNGKVKSFHPFAFVPDNQGVIVWKGIRIWEKGKFTKEGKEIKKRGEITIED